MEKKSVLEQVLPVGKQLEVPNPHQDNEVMTAVVSYHTADHAVAEFLIGGEVIKLTVSIEELQSCGED